MQAIMAQVFQFGLEAQSGHYVAMLRGMEAFDPEPIRQAGELARALFQRLSVQFGTRLYQGGPGVSFSADDFSEVVYERAGTRQQCELACWARIRAADRHWPASLAGWQLSESVRARAKHVEGPAL